MRIGMILDCPRLPDIRVEKEAGVLLNAGWEVGLLAPVDPKNDSAQTREESKRRTRCQLFPTTVENITIVASGWKHRFQMIPNKVLRRPYTRERAWSEVLGYDARQFIRSGVSPRWVRAISAFIDDFRPDVLHVHDLITLPSALRAAKKDDIPVVADLHENYPAAQEAYRIANPDFRNALWRRPDVWREHEKTYLPQCTKVLVVVPEAAERLIEYGVNKDQIALVSNTEDHTTFDVQPSDNAIADRYQDRWVALYTGGVGFHRGLETILEATSMVAQNCEQFLFLVVGANEKYQRRLAEMIERLQVSQHVEVLGWQPAELVSSYMAACQVGLVPHRNLEHTNTTIPHKLFQYMLMSKPVLVSSCPPLKRVVEDSKSGLVFEADNAISAAEKLLAMIHDPAELEAYGKNGREAAEGSYAWSNDATRLVNLYSELAQSHGLQFNECAR